MSRERGIKLDDAYPTRVIPAIVWHWYWVRRFLLPFEGRCPTGMADLNLSGTPVMVNRVDARVRQEELLEELRGITDDFKEWQRSGKSFSVMSSGFVSSSLGLRAWT